MNFQSSRKRFFQEKRQYLIAISLGLFLYSFSLIPVFVPGIDQPSAIGPYLNGIFPAEPSSSSGQDWELENAYPNLTFVDPMALLELPNQESFYLVSKTGLISQLTNDPTITSATTVLDIADRVDTGVDNGVSNAVLHPEFGQAGSPNRGYIYLYYRYHPEGEEADCHIPTFLRLSRFNRPDGSTQFDPNSELVLIQTFDEQCFHSGGAMFFDQEGYLYLATGDAGGEGDEFEVTQRINERLMSGLLRIDVDKDATRSHPIRRQQVDPSYMPFTDRSSFQQEYYIPNDNPFVDESGNNLEEFFAIGLRAPHRGTVDALTGEIWIADVGESGQEEISIVPKGGNMQWPFREGFGTTGHSAPDPLIGVSTPPIYEYDHSVGNAIIGGFVYRGNHYQGALNGKFIFGDHGTRNIWSYNPITEEVTLLTTAPDFGEGENRGISSFATNAAGDIFVLKLFGTDRDGGVIYKLKQGNVAFEPPSLLSQTGAFTDLVNLSPAPGLVPYTVNSPFWSDRAAKKRWIALPNDGTHDTAEEQITFSAIGDWQFPAGTVFIKHFELPVDYNNPSITKRLETRFFVLTSNGEAYGVTYKWNDEGTDAELLVNAETKDFVVSYADGSSGIQTWTYPDRAACMTCHNANAGLVLGTRTWQLNGALTYPSGITANQLNTWLQLGMFENPFDPSEIPDFLQAVDINDSSASLENRVRSYLDSNCSNCHQPNGVDGAFDARFSTPLQDQNILWTQGVSRNTPDDHYMIKPLDTERSEIWIRDGGLGQDAMPPISKNLVDETYMDVLTDWINSLSEEACVEFNTPCSDGNPCTVDDSYDEDCNCVGIFLDSDGDNVSDICDVCPDADDNLDNDADSVPDDCDQCPGFDDSIDLDENGIPDGCDEANCSDQFGINCPNEDCAINDVPIPFDLYTASQKITSEGQVVTQEDVIFVAGNSIVLKPGFRVEAGAIFQAIIIECEEARVETKLPIESQAVQVEEGQEQMRLHKQTPGEKVGYQNTTLLVNVRPNPFHGEFRLLIEAPDIESNSALIRIMDINGRVVYQKFGAPFNEEIRIQAHNEWSNGVYIIHVIASNYTFTQTILKQ